MGQRTKKINLLGLRTHLSADFATSVAATPLLTHSIQKSIAFGLSNNKILIYEAICKEGDINSSQLERIEIYSFY